MWRRLESGAAWAFPHRVTFWVVFTAAIVYFLIADYLVFLLLGLVHGSVSSLTSKDFLLVSVTLFPQFLALLGLAVSRYRYQIGAIVTVLSVCHLVLLWHLFARL